MENKRQSGDSLRDECCGAKEDEEMETFFGLIRRFGELRRKSADRGDQDHGRNQVERVHRKKMKSTVNGRFDHDQVKKKRSGSSSSSNWVPRFQLEDFGEEIGCRRSLSAPELINDVAQQQEVSINSKHLLPIQVRDNDELAKHDELDDEDDSGLNLKLAL